MPWLTTKETSKLSHWKRNLCNKLFPKLWDYPCGCVSLPFGKSCFTAFSLQWCHMSVVASQITNRLTICSTAWPRWEHKIHRNSLIGVVIICKTEIAFYSIVITVTQHERHDVSYPQDIDCLFNGWSWLIAKETSTLSCLKVCHRKNSYTESDLKILCLSGKIILYKYRQKIIDYNCHEKFGINHFWNKDGVWC